MAGRMMVIGDTATYPREDDSSRFAAGAGGMARLALPGGKGEKKRVSYTKQPVPKVEPEMLENVQCEGWLQKQGGKIRTWKRRWCVLQNQTLYYFAQPSHCRCKGQITLPSYSILPAESELRRKFAFKAAHRSARTYYFVADDEESLRMWIVALSAAAMLPAVDHQFRYLLPRTDDELLEDAQELMFHGQDYLHELSSMRANIISDTDWASYGVDAPSPAERRSLELSSPLASAQRQSSRRFAFPQSSPLANLAEDGNELRDDDDDDDDDDGSDSTSPMPSRPPSGLFSEDVSPVVVALHPRRSRVVDADEAAALRTDATDAVIAIVLTPAVAPLAPTLAAAPRMIAHAPPSDAVDAADGSAALLRARAHRSNSELAAMLDDLEQQCDRLNGWAAVEAPAEQSEPPAAAAEQPPQPQGVRAGVARRATDPTPPDRAFLSVDVRARASSQPQPLEEVEEEEKEEEEKSGRQRVEFCTLCDKMVLAGSLFRDEEKDGAVYHRACYAELYRRQAGESPAVSLLRASPASR